MKVTIKLVVPMEITFDYHKREKDDIESYDLPSEPSIPGVVDILSTEVQLSQKTLNEYSDKILDACWNYLEESKLL